MSVNFIRKMSNTVLSSCSPFKLALVQIGAGADKSKNLSHAREKIMEASQNGAQVVVLPVMYPCSTFMLMTRRTGILTLSSF